VPGSSTAKVVEVGSTFVLNSVESTIVSSVRVNVSVEVRVNVPLPIVVLKMDLEMLSPPRMVVPGITEENVDVTKKELMTVTVDGNLVVDTSMTTELVEVPVIVTTEGAAVIVVTKDSTSPQPVGTIDGPAGRHAARPGY
jgi:hypothetical protein